jgi:hypothetical protein
VECCLEQKEFERGWRGHGQVWGCTDICFARQPRKKLRCLITRKSWLRI